MIPFDLTASGVPRDDICEAEAVYLGGCLQIPRRGLLWAIQKGLNVEQIARHFGASVAMVQYRANMTGQRKRIDRIPATGDLLMGQLSLVLESVKGLNTSHADLESHRLRPSQQCLRKVTERTTGLH